MGYVAAGSLGVDFSSARPSIPSLQRARAAFVSRYYKLSATNGYNLTPAEAELYLAAGIGIDGNAENDTDDLIQDEATTTARARIFVARAKACGQPAGTPLTFSHDRAPVDSDRALVMRNLKICFNVAHGEGGYTDATYGGLKMMQWCDDEGIANALRWQSFGWSTVLGSSEANAVANAQRRYQIGRAHV